MAAEPEFLKRRQYRWVRLLTPIVAAVGIALWQYVAGGPGAGTAAGTSARFAPTVPSFNIIAAPTTGDASLLASSSTRPRRPTLLRGTAAEKWAVFQEGWNASRIAESIGEVQKARASGSGHFTYYDHTQPWSSLEQPTSAPVARTLATCVLMAEGCDVYDEWADHSVVDVSAVKYYAHMPLASAGRLSAALQPVSGMAVGDAAVDHASVWMGSAGAKATPHYDVKHNTFVQVLGRKRFTLLPPMQHVGLHLHPALHPSWRQSQVLMPPHVNKKTFPLYHDLNAYQVELHPGDVLFVPAYWLHYVEAIDSCVSVSIWSESSSHVTADDIEAAPLPFNPSDLPDKVAVLARSHIRSVFNAVFKEQGGSRAMLEDLLLSRYPYISTAKPEGRPPPSMWLLFLGSQVAEATRQALVEPGEVRDLVKDCARRVAKLLASLPKGVRSIVAFDHVEQVASSVIELAALNAPRSANDNDGDDIGDSSTTPTPLEVFAFIRDALLSEDGSRA